MTEEKRRIINAELDAHRVMKHLRNMILEELERSVRSEGVKVVVQPQRGWLRRLLGV